MTWQEVFWFVGTSLLAGYAIVCVANVLTWLLVTTVGPSRFGIDPADVPDIRATWWHVTLPQ